MDVKFFCPRWGQEELGLGLFIKKVKSAGFDGIEMPVSPIESEKQALKALLEENKLMFIAQVLEAGMGKGFEEQLRETVFI